MARKGILDQLIDVVEKTFDGLEKAALHALDKIEGQEESPSEESFEPTPGYRPHIGDKVSIQPVSEILVGRVWKVNSDHETAQVIHEIGEKQEWSWTVPWKSIKSLEPSVPNPAQQTPSSLEAYYEARLRRVEEDAQKVSRQHQDFVFQLRAALGVHTKPDSAFTENDVLSLAKSRLSTLNIILKRLGTQDNLAAIHAIEDLMGNR
jgi:hypothetical protein